VRITYIAVDVAGLVVRRQAVDEVHVRWRVDVGEEQSICLFDLDLDGRTTSLTTTAARTLRDKLAVAMATVDRFAAAEETRAALRAAGEALAEG